MTRLQKETSDYTWNAADVSCNDHLFFSGTEHIQLHSWFFMPWIFVAPAIIKKLLARWRKFLTKSFLAGKFRSWQLSVIDDFTSTYFIPFPRPVLSRGTLDILLNFRSIITMASASRAGHYITNSFVFPRHLLLQKILMDPCHNRRCANPYIDSPTSKRTLIDKKQTKKKQLFHVTRIENSMANGF